LKTYLPTIGRCYQWPRTEKDHELSTAKGHLMRLVHRFHVPGAEALLTALDLRKMLESFGEKYAAEHVHSGKIFPRYNIGGARTGRFSSEDPNIQQLPVRRSHFRRCVVATPSYRFVEADYSQIELRASAEVADLPAMRQVYVEGRDLHNETATRVNGRSITKGDRERNAAKTINFQTIYGGGPAKMAYIVFKDYGIVITEDQAREYQEAFFSICTGLKEWMKEQYARVRKCGYVEIGSGRIVEAVWQPDKELRYTQAVNYPVQGICGECAKRALARLYSRIRTDGLAGRIRIINIVHDSILLLAEEALIQQAACILDEEMLAAFIATFPKASTRKLIEIKTGPTWGDMTKL